MALLLVIVNKVCVYKTILWLRVGCQSWCSSRSSGFYLDISRVFDFLFLIGYWRLLILVVTCISVHDMFLNNYVCAEYMSESLSFFSFFCDIKVCKQLFHKSGLVVYFCKATLDNAHMSLCLQLKQLAHDSEVFF